LSGKDAGQSTLEACAPLNDAVAKRFVPSDEQILHQIVTAFMGIAHGAGEMMIDSHARRLTETIRNGKNFTRVIRWTG
jgi:hypothetical protein